MNKREKTCELLKQVKFLYAEKPVVNNLLSAMGRKRLCDVEDDDLDALAELARHYINKSTKSALSQTYVERILDIEIGHNDHNAEYSEAIRDIESEIKSREGSGLDLKGIRSAVNILLDISKRRDAELCREASTFLSKNLFGAT